MIRLLGVWLAYLVFVLWGITLVTFVLTSAAPGDPAMVLLSEVQDGIDPDQVEALRRALGIDVPYYRQYGAWLANVMVGDFGVSWRTGEPVCATILARLPATMELAAASFLLIVLLSTVLGVLAVLLRNTFWDALLRGVSVLVQALPGFWLALLLILFFSLYLGWLPVMGRGSFRHLVLPAMTLALGIAALQGRMLRAALLDVLSQEYILFAKAKGLGTGTIIVRHALRNALPPIVTFWGIALGNVLTGSVIVEMIFSWPGLGQLLIQSVVSRDIPLLQGIVLIMAFIYVIINRLTILIQSLLDPRLGNIGPVHGVMVKS